MTDWTDRQTELHIHQGAPEATDGGHCAPRLEENTVAHNYDNEQHWTIETYDRKSANTLTRIGATEVKSAHDGRIFDLDAHQLIEFLAEVNGLIIEFRKHKKRQYSEATKEAMRERLAKARAAISA